MLQKIRDILIHYKFRPNFRCWKGNKTTETCPIGIMMKHGMVENSSKLDSLSIFSFIIFLTYLFRLVEI